MLKQITKSLYLDDKTDLKIVKVKEGEPWVILNDKNAIVFKSESLYECENYIDNLSKE